MFLTVNEHGCGQRYTCSADGYNAIFSSNLDIKSDVTHQQYQHEIGYNISAPSIQVQSGLHSLLSAHTPQSNPAAIAIGSHTMGLNVRSNTNFSTTLTDYALEENGGGSPLISLSSSCIMSGTSCALSEHNAIAPEGQPKKRKLSMTECFPVSGSVASAVPISSNKSPNVKQEPRNVKANLAKQFFTTNLILLFPVESSPGSLSPHQGPTMSSDEEYSYEFSADSSMFNDNYQCIRFQAFQQNTWHLLFDNNLKEL